jgi:methionine synthase II (cobalamin-independent)
MFAMLNGAWPRETLDGIDLAVLEADVAAGRAEASDLGAAADRLVAEVLAAQAEAGMDLVSDGQVRWPNLTKAVLRAVEEGRTGPDGMLVAAWKAAAAAAPASATVAQALPGPYTLGRHAIDDAVAKTIEAGEVPPTGAELERARFEVTLGIAETLGGEVEALVAAGCRMIVVEEPDLVRIGRNESHRALFARAGTRLLARSGGVHAMLAVMGGSAHETGGATIFEAPWQSLLVDLIEGPDNWTLVRETPGDRGIVCAALQLQEDGVEVDQAPELVWASQYAASANGRGLERVGLTHATRLADRTPREARSALRQLATAARYASMPIVDAVEAGLDERTIRDARPVPAANNRASRRRQARETGKRGSTPS